MWSLILDEVLPISEINAGLADPKLKARLTDLGSSAFVISSADFGNFIAEDTVK
jgi:hypothetical protein